MQRWVNHGTHSVSSVQLLSCVWLFATPWTAACQAPLSSIISLSFLKSMSVELVILCNHRILCHPLLLLPSIFPSIRVFSNESAHLIRWPKYWSFSMSPFNEYSGLISFRIDWFDLPAIQGTLKNLLQHHSLKASVLWCSAFFMVQLSHLGVFNIKHYFQFYFATTCPSFLMEPNWVFHSISSNNYII